MRLLRVKEASTLRPDESVRTGAQPDMINGGMTAD